MRNDIWCEYKTEAPMISQKEQQENVKIIQLFAENGLLKIGETSYPIVYGDLYFIDAQQSYFIEEVEEEFVQSTIMLSAKMLTKLAKSLDFEGEYHKILEKNGHFHVASPHYKAIDKRFKEAHSVFKADKPLTKALFVSRVIELFNYAVVTLEKGK
ncbi:hypothetical protein A5881_002834 [Enterococcus termitis]|nr:hypothetical protein A5881_003940 [Enterococcus termitis]